MNPLSNPATDTQITHAGRLWLYLLAGAVLVFLAAPTLLVIPMSFTASTFLEFPPKTLSLRWYQAFLASQEWRAAGLVSIQVATLTMLVATPLGVAAAYGLLVGRFRRARAWSGLLVSPMLVPVILIAIGVFFVFVPLRLNNTVTGLVVVHSALSTPFVFVVVLARLRSYDLRQEMAAQSLGASRLWAFLTVTLPQIRFAVLSGALLAFIHSFDEVVVAFFVATGPTSTLTRRMFLALEFGIDPTIAAISSCMILLTIVCVAATQILTFDRQGARVPLTSG